MNRIIATAALLFATLAVHAQAMTDAEVKKIDKAGARITLKHGEIKTMDVPAMTMAYRVKDPAMLDRVQVGDKVRFTMERVDSQYTIVRIEK